MAALRCCLHLLLFLSCIAFAQAMRKTVSQGDLRIPCQGSCTAAQTSPISVKAGMAMADNCMQSATADLPARWQLPQYHTASQRRPSKSELKHGPHLNLYQAVTASQVPANCNPTTWAWQRLLRTVTDTIALDTNYCHHHAPSYEAPPSVRQQCAPSEPGGDIESCSCSAAGMDKLNAWKGVDCSNLVAFVYNFAFGFYPTSNISEQACHPTKAPGRLLARVTTSKLDQLLPGDLAFITLSSKGRSPPVRVTHVVLWTGWTVDFGGSGPLSKSVLMANVRDSEKPSIEKCMADSQAAGQPVYVIADSHFNGPALRPFCGWYTGSFSHARRLINPDSSLPTNSNAIGMWDQASGTCLSKWALRG